MDWHGVLQDWPNWAPNMVEICFLGFNGNEWLIIPRRYIIKHGDEVV